MLFAFKLINLKVEFIVVLSLKPLRYKKKQKDTKKLKKDISMMKELKL